MTRRIKIYNILFTKFLGLMSNLLKKHLGQLICSINSRFISFHYEQKSLHQNALINKNISFEISIFKAQSFFYLLRIVMTLFIDFKRLFI